MFSARMLLRWTFLFLGLALGVDTKQRKGRCGEFRLASYFDSSMVLQREPARASIWGYANTIHDLIFIKMGQDTFITKPYPGDGGKLLWRVFLNPMPAGGPYTISVTSTKCMIKLTDVLFGDVWLCGGQGNMFFRLYELNDPEPNILEVGNYSNVRTLKLPKKFSEEPLSDIKPAQTWTKPRPDKTVSFSAVCWLFGRNLNRELRVPIGLIQLAWGGSRMPAWSPPEVFNDCYPNGTDEGEKQHANSVIYNAMIHPLLSMTITGAIWYQDEYNQLNEEDYGCAFQSMVAHLRRKFFTETDGETSTLFPFGQVQLGAKGDVDNEFGLPEMRWVQTAKFGFTPNSRLERVFTAVSMDLPDFLSPYGLSRSRYKRPIADRLTLGALNIAYGKTDIEFQGPLPKRFFWHGDQLDLDFDQTKLDFRSTKGFEDKPIFCSADKDDWTPVEIERQFSSELSLNVPCKGEERLTGVRYAWRESPCELEKCAVYGRDSGLPAPMFVRNIIPTRDSDTCDKFGLASYFASEMVLQRAPARASIWGYANNIDQEITICMDEQVITTKTFLGKGNEVVWEAFLDPVAAGGPHNILISYGRCRIQLNDVMFGDVWLCSGQSNMYFRLRELDDPEGDIKDVVNFPNVRIFRSRKVIAHEPQYDMKDPQHTWSRPSEGRTQWFSAVCWLFGRNLNRKLGIPIGLLQTSYEGTRIEAWSPPEVFDDCFPNGIEEREAENEKSVLYNGMIHPFLPMTIKGAIWYQGESNQRNPQDYSCALGSMMKHWRNNFHTSTGGETDKLFPFGVVQLATNNDVDNEYGLPEVRWAQTAEFGYTPNPERERVFMAVAMDLPDFYAPLGRYKRPIADRLTLGALNIAYGKTDVQFEGPFPSNYYWHKDGLEVVYDERKTMLDHRSTDGFEICCSKNESSFCGIDKEEWNSVQVKEQLTTYVILDVTCEENEVITGVRYDWRESPCPLEKCAVYGKDTNLPAPPFVVHQYIPYQKELCGNFGLASSYGSEMVLQRGPARASIWGYANVVGEDITVEMDQQVIVTKAYLGEGNKILWKVRLEPMVAGGPYTITVSSERCHSELTDVMFGDVWLCSGQSNMVFKLRELKRPEVDIEDVVNYPNVRTFKAQKIYSDEPQIDMTDPLSTWSKPSKGGTQWFSAVCWLFGRNLNRMFGIPIGLVQSAFEGTRIEAWSPPEVFEDCFPNGTEDREKQNAKSALYNGMIHPFLSMTITGAIWYQGEGNQGNAKEYSCAFGSMVKHWRKKFHQNTNEETDLLFPFGQVQLAPNRDKDAVTGLTEVRWAQTAEYGYTPNPERERIFTAVAMDLPDFLSPYGTIHPRYKRPIAERLTLGALNIAYGLTDIQFQGPHPTEFICYNEGLEIVFDDGKATLSHRSKDGFEICCSNDENTLCGTSIKEWNTATVKHQYSSRIILEVTCEIGEVITGVRYAWRESPCPLEECAVYGEESGLPAAPFLLNKHISYQGDLCDKFGMPSYFGNSMVLQRAPARASIWGYADVAGEEITIEMDDQVTVTTAFQDGRNNVIWKVLLNPVEAGGPHTIRVSSVRCQSLLTDVMFGDVWICSGETNMKFRLREPYDKTCGSLTDCLSLNTCVKLDNPEDDVYDVENFQDVRSFRARSVYFDEPQIDMPNPSHAWSRPSVGRTQWFSAVCWLFGRNLYQKLGVPIGLVQSAFDNTRIEAWSPPEVFHDCFPDGVKEASGENAKSVVYNGMIHPFLRTTITGVIWYQGESNQDNPQEYGCAFESMVKHWRNNFFQNTNEETDILLPFGQVQLGASGDNDLETGLPEIRWAQTADFGYTPNQDLQQVFTAAAMDLPDFYSPYGSIRSRYKRPVAERLTLGALNVAYGQKDIQFQGPTHTEYFWHKQGLEIVYGEGKDELEYRSTDGFEICCSKDEAHICSINKEEWESVKIKQQFSSRLVIDVPCKADEVITGVRYAWRESPCPREECALYGKESGLPAQPFVLNEYIPFQKDLCGKFGLAAYYSSEMVLQRAPAKASIWGYANIVGERITVKIDTQVIVTKAVLDEGNNVTWRVLLEPMKSGGPFTLAVSTGRCLVELTDVMFGDVWICSGQSNIYFRLRELNDPGPDIKDVVNYPNVRIFRSRKVIADEPQVDMVDPQHTWSKPSEGRNQWFSAVCWLFGRNLNRKLGIPIGLLQSSFEGTRIEAWSPPEVFDECFPDGTKNVAGENAKSVLYNGMIHPFLPMTIKGALWYQGESNQGNAQDYSCALGSMIKHWRTNFHNNSNGQTDLVFPVGVVQLATNKDIDRETGFPEVRWAQTGNYGYTPNPERERIFTAVAMDLPDFYSPYGSIHPRYKRPIADRLTRGALNVAYGYTSVEFQGPFPTDFIWQEAGLEIMYDSGQTKLDHRSKEGFEICCSKDNTTRCGINKEEWSSVSIKHQFSSRVILSVPCQTDEVITGVRYAWRESPCPLEKCAIYGKETDLPAPQFVLNQHIPFQEDMCGDFGLPSYYATSMVLQRAPARASIWGYANVVGERITVEIDKQVIETRAFLGKGNKVIWEVLLDPIPAGGPYNLKASSMKCNIELVDVMFGDVWLCSGQSNMYFRLRELRKPEPDLEDVENYPNVRIFRSRKVIAKEPQYDMKDPQHTWSRPSPGRNQWFSAVCWLFGRNLNRELGIPIGLVQSAFEGTRIEAWSPPEVFNECFPNGAREEQAENAKSVLYNGMIHPFVHMTITGAIWYQGESNQRNPQDYSCALGSMVKHWRENFSENTKGQTDILFPFGQVQLATNRRVDEEYRFPEVRWAQTAEYGYTPNPDRERIFTAVAMDLPDYYSPYGSIHPRYKRPIADRLTRGALNIAYSQKEVEFKGPFPSQYSYNSSGLEITYDVTLDLRARNGFEICCSEDKDTSCGIDKDEWDSARIKRVFPTAIILNVPCKANEVITGVRYAWRESPCLRLHCAVYGKTSGLPGPQFVHDQYIQYKP